MVTLPGSPVASGLALSNTTLCARVLVATLPSAGSTVTSVNAPPGPVVMPIVNGAPNIGNVTRGRRIDGGRGWNTDAADEHCPQHYSGYAYQVSLHSVTTSEIVRRARVGLLGCLEMTRPVQARGFGIKTVLTINSRE